MCTNNQKRIRISLLITAFIVAFLPLASCHALSAQYLDRFAANNIMFYDPEECPPNSSGGGSGLSGSDTKTKMWNFFRSKGLNEAQTAGVLGNAMTESSFIVTRASNSNYWGLFQYNTSSGGEAAAMYSQIEKEGLSKYVDHDAYGASDSSIPEKDLNRLIEIQLNFAWDEWRKDYNPYWRERIQENVGDEHEPEWAAEVFVVHFEGAIGNSSYPGEELIYYSSSSTWQGAGSRRANARDIYDEFKGTTVQGGSSFVGGYTSSDVCCDPGAKKKTDGIYQGTRYALSDGQVAGLAAVANQENGGSVAGIKTEASIMANLLEYKRPSSKGDPDELVDYVLNGRWFNSTSTSKYSESYSNTEYIEAVKDVLVEGNRTIPPQILEHDCINCSAGINSATNNGEEIDLSDKSKFIRGVTVLQQGSGGLNGSYIFWDWADPETKKGDPFGYFANNPPDEGVLNATTGTSSAGVSGSSTVWENGWITNGLSGYVKSQATSSNVSGLDASFGQQYTTTSAKGEGQGPDKITIHATSSSNAGGGDAINLYSGNPYPPHFTIDMKTRKAYQHGAVDRSSSAMGSGGANSSAGVQVSLIGYATASESNPGFDLSSESDFSEDDWKYVAEVLMAISVETGVSLDTGIAGADVGDGVLANIKKGIQALSASQNEVCPDGPAGNVKALQEAVYKYAWDQYYSSDTGKRGIDSRKPEYKELIDGGVWYAGGCSGNDCGGFVTTMMRESGFDEEYNPNKCGTYCDGQGQAHYLETSEKWEDVTATISSNDDAKPGDVLISHGHTLMFVGDIQDFGGKMASASYATKCPDGTDDCDGDDRVADCPRTRPPMADSASDIYDGYIRGGKYRVFRKVR